LSANPLLSKLSDAKKCPHSFWKLVTLIIVGAYASKHLHSSLFKEAAAMSCVLLPILSKDAVICKDKPGETMGKRKKMRKIQGKKEEVDIGRLDRETVAVKQVPFASTKARDASGPLYVPALMPGERSPERLPGSGNVRRPWGASMSSLSASGPSDVGNGCLQTRRMQTHTHTPMTIIFKLFKDFPTSTFCAVAALVSWYLVMTAPMCCRRVEC